MTSRIPDRGRFSRRDARPFWRASPGRSFTGLLLPDLFDEPWRVARSTRGDG
jgi:hypothetical protein